MFNLVTEEHRMIRESVRKLFADLEAADTSMRQHENGRIASVTVGRALTDLGLFGDTLDDVPMSLAQVQALVALEAGTVSLPFPVLEMLSTHALAMRSEGFDKADSAGTRTLSSTNCKLLELPVLESGRLHGTTRLIPFIGLAERVLVEARRGDEIVLVEVALAGEDIECKARAAVESEYLLHDLSFSGAPASLPIKCLDQNSSASSFLRQRTSLLAAAEIAGACRRMVEMTRDYLLIRSQFGQVLGSNQALKHAMADNHVQVEALAAAIDYAAAAIDAGSVDADASVCAAKYFASRAGKAVAESVLQLHGAIGYTMEFPLHLLMRRVYRLTASYGSNQIQGEKLFEIFRDSV